MSATELHKSSAEILSELFSSFNVEPPNLEQKLSKKHKKSKKKHKRKEKKHKKKSKYKYSSSSSDQSSSEKDGHRKHKSKKRCKVYDSDSSNANVLNGFAYGLQNIEIKLESELGTPVAVKTETTVPEPSNSENNEFSSVTLSEEQTLTNQHGSSQEPQNTNMCQETNADKSAGKISIKNLKNSSVYEATIREVKEKEQEHAARFEEGELTKSENEDDDDIDNIISSELVQKHGESNRHSRKRKSSDGERSKHHDSKRSRKDKRKSHQRSRSKDRNVNREHDSTYYYRSSHSYHESSGYSRYRYKEGKKRSRSKERSPSRVASKDRSSHRADRKWRSRSPSSSIDKKKLLEIARKNAINMLKSGTLPEALTLGPQAQEKVIAAIKAGGKTIEELTDFCKNLSKKEELGELSSVSSNEDDVESTSENEKVFHHPFQIKDKPTSIVMNIKNATPLPLKTAKEKSAELRMQFPVSSGQLHRKTENEWVPVSPKRMETASVPAPVAVMPPVSNILPSTITVTLPESALNTIIAAASPTQADMDISSIVSQRLSLMRKLQENPNDVQALNQMYRVQQEMQTWAQSKQQPGQFTGSTGAQILSAAELSSGYQAWARKDQLQNAAPVTGGMGMHLLQKMGWKPGEGLGKEKTGSLEPLLLEVKLDKKGLVANEEVKFKKPTKLQKTTNTVKTLAGKHPVSLLGEFATKRKLGVPQYECCFECGPDHKKNFLFKVILNGIEYKPNVASSTKKQAKADAATLCLQQLGLLAS